MRRVLADRLTAARVSAAIRADWVLERHGRNIRVSVDGDEIRLYGVVSNGSSLKLAERIAAAQCGQRRVRNELVRVRGFAE